LGINIDFSLYHISNSKTLSEHDHTVSYIILRQSYKTSRGEAVKKRRTFWDDPSIGPRLDAIPDGELSTIVRMALRQYFGISPSKPPEPITPDAARLVARELMLNLKAERS